MSIRFAPTSLLMISCQSGFLLASFLQYKEIQGVWKYWPSCNLHCIELAAPPLTETCNYAYEAHFKNKCRLSRNQEPRPYGTMEPAFLSPLN